MNRILSKAFEKSNSEHKNTKKNVKIFFDRLTAIFGLRIFIATLRMYLKNCWADWAEIFRIVKGEDCRTVQKILSRSDPYGRWPIRPKMATKISNTYFHCLFQPLSACKIGHRCQIGTKFCIQPSNSPLWRSWRFQLDQYSQFGCTFSKWQ